MPQIIQFVCVYVYVCVCVCVCVRFFYKLLRQFSAHLAQMPWSTELPSAFLEPCGPFL